MSTTPMNNGAIVHIEIPAPDLEKAKHFYGTLFQWKITDAGSDYAIFQADGVGGGLNANQDASDQGVILYIKVADIPAKLKEIEEAGGAVIKARAEIGGDYGFFALFRDPNGNRLALWSKS